MKRKKKSLPKTQQQLVEACTQLIEDGEAEKLLQTFEGIRDTGMLDSRLLRVAMEGGLKLKRPDLVANFFENSRNESEEAEAGRGGPKLFEVQNKDKKIMDAACVSVAIEAYGRMGKVEDALALFLDLRSLHIRREESTYNSIIRACVYNNRLAEARQFIEEMDRDGLMEFMASEVRAALQDESGGMLADYSKSHDELAHKRPMFRPKKKMVTSKEILG